MTIANTVSNTTFSQLRTKVNQIIGVVNTLGTGNVSNTYLQATFATKAYAASNTAVRVLINERLQVANAAATYQTKAIERAALANTNAYIATKVNTSTFNVALANTNAYIASVAANSGGATWTALTSTNTALRTLINDRLQVANAAAIYQTKIVERAALANTNAYIATRATWFALKSTNTALRTYVDTSVAAIVNTAPGTLNTLQELASALANDANFAVTTTNLIATKISVANTKAYLANTNAFINTKANWSALTATNTALRTLINDRIQVANVAATYQTKTAERAALANTNIAIAAKASWSALTSTNTALRTLISNRYQVANVNTLLATKASWSALTSTNTALRILISDRIQVANVAAKYATKAYAASNAYVKLLLANTNAYIADVAASTGGGGGDFSAEALDYGFITSSADVDLNRDYGTL